MKSLKHATAKKTSYFTVMFQKKGQIKVARADYIKHLLIWLNKHSKARKMLQRQI